MPHVIQVVTICASVDAIWKVISDFGAGSTYLAMVTHCTVQGNGVGALRTLTYLDSSVIVERLEMLDEVSHCLSYTLLTETLFGGCLTTMLLHALSTEQAELTWSVNFQRVDLPEDEAVSLLEGMLAANCQTVKRLLER
jgi:hypothetical protein